MSWKPFVAMSFFLSVGMTALPLPEAIAAPDNLMAASPWQPIARINPAKPFQVQINNKTGIGLEYSSTTNEFPPRKLAASGTTTLNQLPTPIYLLISPLDGRFNLKYTVSTRNNLVMVTVTQLPDSNPGNTTVNIQETGGIFVY
ncbi:MAG: hypothetical protein LH647_07135 [Leptolyngbyaceae cyanobacterium CAN_BIN12]|nr:hypothetical protein [Leptolyngbyaceae cyanobacterium CAN_BIN12]